MLSGYRHLLYPYMQYLIIVSYGIGMWHLATPAPIFVLCNLITATNSISMYNLVTATSYIWIQSGYRHRYVQPQTCISPEPGAKTNWQWDRVGWMLADHGDGLSSSSFLAWSSIAQSGCQRAFGLLAIWCLRPWVRILHSAGEDNLSPSDSNIACLCQSIEINEKTYTVWLQPPAISISDV